LMRMAASIAMSAMSSPVGRIERSVVPNAVRCVGANPRSSFAYCETPIEGETCSQH